MDLWVVAAAAGAGYIAKNLQNLSIDKSENLTTTSYYSPSGSRNFLQQFRDKTCPLRRLAETHVLDGSSSCSEMGNDSNVWVSETDSLGFRNLESGSGDDCNLGWASSLPSVFSTGGSLGFEEVSRNLGRVKRGNKFVGSSRRRRRKFRPDRALNSLGCFDAQQCSGHDSLEEDTPCLYPSISQARPVLVTDWSGMIDRPGSNYLAEAPQRKPEKGGSGEGVSGRSSIGSQGQNTMLLFITGTIVGILSATTTWKNEVDRLNKLLKQMQNLVQDLQDELDMKEMLMVKELPAEGHPSPGEQEQHQKPLPIHEPIVSPSDVKLTEFDILKANARHAESLELLSTIEAELQAELETLENNINNGSGVDRISGVIELDPDFQPEIVQGDLKPAMANALSDSGTESTNTATDCSQPANYSVSPWELSLRLHELIESRLEMRIRELEMALANSLNRTQVLDSTVFDQKYSRSETESSSVHRSPTCICDEQSADKEANGIPKQDRAVESVESVHDVPCSVKQTSTSFMSNVGSESDDEGADESEMLLIKRIVERRRSASNFKLEMDGWG